MIALNLRPDLRLVGVLLMLFVAACSRDASTPSADAGVDDATLTPQVVAALESAARGTPFPDDLHPGTAKTGRVLTDAQAAFDVKHYALRLRVMPESFSIEGAVTVILEGIVPTQVVELDLDPNLEIVAASHNGQTRPVRREEDRFSIILAGPLKSGERTSVTVEYRGQPHIAKAPPWHGGFVWSEHEGTPWFATAVQTEGCDLWWPCKDTYADKPDDGASVGVLDRMEVGDDGFDTWFWSSRHPYTGYAIAINGGPFVRIEEEYQGVSGVFPVQFWALPKNEQNARNLIKSDVRPHLEFFERLLGPYPWGDEKAGFVETPHLGMEHQTINAYGEQYSRGSHGFDQLLHHELAHEWFGNVMTHARPEDSWVHEGYASYMQAVYAEQITGRMGYFDRMFNAYTHSEHCVAVAQPEVVDVGEAFDNRDIYTKGAWMLHTLRNYIGEYAFWAGTRRLIYGTDDPWSLQYPIRTRYRDTQEFVRIMSDVAGEDIGWLVDTYLYEAGMPELRTTREGGRLDLEWIVPGGRAFPMPVTVSIDGESVVVPMTSESRSIEVPSEARVVIDPESHILRALPIIDNCEAQTDSQMQDNIDRYSRMAREYGWRRQATSRADRDEE